MSSKRIFLAVDVPNKVRKKVERVKQDFKEIKAKIKWVEEENTHVSLWFLGKTEEDKIELLKENLGQVAKSFKPFILKVEGVGVFPNERDVRVLWLGVDSPDLINLRRKLEKKLIQGITFPPVVHVRFAKRQGSFCGNTLKE